MLNVAIIVYIVLHSLILLYYFYYYYHHQPGLGSWCQFYLYVCLFCGGKKAAADDDTSAFLDANIQNTKLFSFRFWLRLSMCSCIKSVLCSFFLRLLLPLFLNIILHHKYIVVAQMKHLKYKRAKRQKKRKKNWKK